MKIPTELNIMEVRCASKNKKAIRCGRYLGRFQVDGTNRYGDYPCPVCHATTQLYIDEVGIFHIDTIQNNKILKAPFIPAHVGE